MEDEIRAASDERKGEEALTQTSDISKIFTFLFLISRGHGDQTVDHFRQLVLSKSRRDGRKAEGQKEIE